MFLTMDIVRWLAIRAIRGRTWAGDLVLDSPASTADVRFKENRAPFVAVYVDDADATMTGESWATGAETKLYLIIEVASAQKIEIRDPEENQTTDTGTPASGTAVVLRETDAALEFQVNMIARQVASALNATDNIWSDLWKKFCPGRDSVTVRRGGPGQNEDMPVAIRYASKVITWTLQVLDDPVYGEPVPEGPWTDLLAALTDVGGGTAELARVLRAHIETRSGPIADWRQAQKQLALAEDGIRALAIAPWVIPDDITAPVLEDLDIHSDGSDVTFDVGSGTSDEA